MRFRLLLLLLCLDLALGPALAACLCMLEGEGGATPLAQQTEQPCPRHGSASPDPVPPPVDSDCAHCSLCLMPSVLLLPAWSMAAAPSADQAQLLGSGFAPLRIPELPLRPPIRSFV